MRQWWAVSSAVWKLVLVAVGVISTVVVLGFFVFEDDDAATVASAPTTRSTVDAPEITTGPAPSDAAVPWPTTPNFAVAGDAKVTDPPYVQDVPVPDFMVLSFHSSYRSDSTLRGVAQTTMWKLADAVARSDLDAFYDAQMPIGEDFGEWQWCRVEEIGGELNEVQRLYERPGTNQILDLTLIDTGMLLGTDESGPCS